MGQQHTFKRYILQSHHDNAKFIASKTLIDLEIERAPTAFGTLSRSMEKRRIWRTAFWRLFYSETPNPLSANFTKWSNTLLGHFVGLELKGLKSFQKPSTIAEILRTFKQLMQKGNISAALNLLTNNMDHDILPLDQKTISQLVLNHPQKSCTLDDILINGPQEKVHLVRFESINE